MKSNRNYFLLLVAQSLTAFSDNAILAVILGQLVLLQQKGVLSLQMLGKANAIYTSLLFIPYIFLAPLCGFLNDRFSKTTSFSFANIIKLAGALCCFLSIVFGEVWQMSGYLFIGVGAAIYSPAKYGILPEILPAEDLVKANGTMELLTLISILTGTIGGALLIDHFSPNLCYSIIIGIYFVAFLFNLLMKKTSFLSTVQFLHSFSEFFENFFSLMQRVRFRKILFGTSLFWFCGAAMKMNFQPWGLTVLHLQNNTKIALLGLWLSIGIMIGSVLAGIRHQVSDLHKTRRYGWLLASSIFLLFAISEFKNETYFAPYIYFFAIALLILTGIFGGLYLIPLNAALQHESNPTRLGKTIAAQNFIENISMLLCGGLIWLAAKNGVFPSHLFLFLALITGFIVLFLKIPAKVIEESPKIPFT